MRYLEPVSEDEMVAVFLQTEIHSDRFSAEILALLDRSGHDRSVVDTPDARDLEENEYRAWLLGEFRGYRQNRDLFEGFPEAVSWHRYALSREELARVRYIDYSYWNALSGGSRLPADAARNIRSGLVVYGVSNDGFLRLAEALRSGAVVPELILVGKDEASPLTVLEGHVRLTAYCLAPECIPDPLTVIVGFAPGFE